MRFLRWLLIKALKQAESTVRALDNIDMDWTSFDSPQEFGDYLAHAQEELRAGHMGVLEKIRITFTPTGDWDNAVGGGSAASLANWIMHLTDTMLWFYRLKRHET